MATGLKCSPPSAASQVLAIVRKDMTSELRSLGTFVTMVIFSLLTITVFSLALGTSQAQSEISYRSQTVPGVLWVAFSFAAMLGLNHAFSSERDSGCIHGLLLSPVPRWVLYLGKLITNLIFVTAVELMTLPAFAILLNIDNFPSLLPKLIVTIILCTWGICAVGTLFSAMSTSGSMREMMLPILLFPVLIPQLDAAITATTAILTNDQSTLLAGGYQLMIGYDILFTLLSATVFRFVVEE